ncbi:MAG: PH domain-containing protein [Opitutales bacterium]
MGLISGLLGHASEVDAERLEKDMEGLLIKGETIEQAYKLIRDLVVLTSKRIVFVDKQGLTGRKREYLCIPYRSVERFSKENTGHVDLDAEIKLWIRGQSEPLLLEFKGSSNVDQVFRTLSRYVLD